MQRTIVIEYEGKEIVSQPFTFKHACLIDDERYRGGGFATGARNALVRMFEGTTLTEEKIDNMIDDKDKHSALKKAVDKILDMYFHIEEETKNSSRPQLEPEAGA